MNSILADTLENHGPKFNQDVTNGLATKILKEAPHYIDAIIKSSMRSAPKDQLEYHGWRKLSPKEEYNSLFTSTVARVPYDTAKSDIYKIELLFSWKGKKLPRRYVYLPFVGEAGIMHITDTKFHVVPVLSDTVVSPTHKEVFVRLLRDKLLFKRTSINILVDGKRESGQVIYSNIYRTGGRDIKDGLGSVVPPVALYLVAEYGFMEAFKKYAGVYPIITDDPDAASKYPDYKVYSSTKIKPRGLKESRYVGHDVKILVPREVDTAYVHGLVTGIMYVFDSFQEYPVEMMNIINSDDREKEEMYWKILLGKIVFKNSYSVDRAHADMNDHFSSLQSYIDNLIKEKLAETDIYVDNFFDLLAVILERYNQWLLRSKEYSNDLYNRYLDILYYLLYDIILGVNMTIFELSRKAVKKDVAEKEVSRIFNNKLSAKTIFRVSKTGGMNISLMLVDYTGDNKYPKITSNLELQERGDGVKRGLQNQFPASIRSITGHDLFLGSLLFLPKKAPTPRVRINPFVRLNVATGRLEPSKGIKDALDTLDSLLVGRETDNYKIRNSELEVDMDNVSVD